MGLSFLIIATCLVFGLIATIASFRPNLFSDIGMNIRRADPVKQFSPKNTLFIIGSAANHPACRMQRRLLKPAIPALIREDVTVMEVYGDDNPRKNGEAIDWLDCALLRHALNTEEGFYIIYVDADGKTRLRSEAPVVTADLIARSGLDIPTPNGKPPKKSSILKKLRAA